MKRIEGYNNEESYRRAKAQVEKLKGFYIHATVYSIFVLVFIWLNLKSGNFPWAIFPIAGWGLGLLGHASDTFQYSILFGKDWEKRKIKEYMEKDNSSIPF